MIKQSYESYWEQEEGNIKKFLCFYCQLCCTFVFILFIAINSIPATISPACDFISTSSGTTHCFHSLCQWPSPDVHHLRLNGSNFLDFFSFQFFSLEYDLACWLLAYHLCTCHSTAQKIRMTSYWLPSRTQVQFGIPIDTQNMFLSLLPSFLLPAFKIFFLLFFPLKLSWNMNI